MYTVNTFNQTANQQPTSYPPTSYPQRKDKQSIQEFYQEVDKAYETHMKYTSLFPNQRQKLQHQHTKLQHIKQKATLPAHIMQVDQRILKIMELLQKPNQDPKQMETQQNSIMEESNRICNDFATKLQMSQEDYFKLIKNQCFLKKKTQNTINEEFQMLIQRIDSIVDQYLKLQLSEKMMICETTQNKPEKKSTILVEPKVKNNIKTNTCKICKINQAIYASVPCFHRAHCETCQSTTNDCLVCGQKVEYFQKLFI